MGLDCFWEMPEGKEHPTFEPPLQLCGGMFSGHGSESFRGKVYYDYIKSVSGISLYNDLVNEEVEQIAEALERAAGDHIKEAWAHDEELFDREMDDLKRMFRKYADAGATLRAWY